MRPIGRFEFRKGDAVPDWIERVTTPAGDPAGPMTFGRDVLAFSDEAGVQLWATGGNDGDCFMRLDGHIGPVRIDGAPTTIRTPMTAKTTFGYRGASHDREASVER